MMMFINVCEMLFKETEENHLGYLHIPTDRRIMLNDRQEG